MWPHKKCALRATWYSTEWKREYWEGTGCPGWRPLKGIGEAGLQIDGNVDYSIFMAEMTVQYPDDLLLASGRPRREVEEELKFQLAVRLFEVGQLSLGKAAELAGWNKVRFGDALGRMKVPVVNLDDDEIQAELSAFRGNHHRG